MQLLPENGLITKERNSMADATTPKHGRLESLRQLSDYEVARDSPDVCGWEICSHEGVTIGTVSDLLVDRRDMKARYLVAHVDRPSREIGASGDILIPVERAQVDERHHRVRTPLVAGRVSAMPRYAGGVPEDAYDSRFGGYEHPDWKPRKTVQRPSGEERRIT